MSKIPELLVTISGEKVGDKKTWENFRKREILALFSEYVYGVRDIEKPVGQFFKTKQETIFKGMRRKDIEVGFGDYSFPFSLYLPLKQDKPLPAIVFPVIEYHEENYEFDEAGNFVCKDLATLRIPVKDITERGFAIAMMPTRNVYPDWEAHAEFRQGVFAAYNMPKERGKNAWATISAWAWGTSRVLDYLETDGDIDCNNVAVGGHSRGGKMALWAAATDERFKLSFSNNSGCMGAAVLRGKEGEHVKDINITDWFCENFRDFNENEEMLPVDQHMLIALIAPRYVYVTSSSEDIWADPTAEYLACHMASEAFELYGVKGIVAPEGKPMADKVFSEGHIAYHLKTGTHSITSYDWDNFLDYFDKIIKQS